MEKPNGKLGACLDPKQLNKALNRQNYKVGTAEELFSKNEKSKVFFLN